MALVLFEDTLVVDADPFIGTSTEWLAATEEEKEQALRSASQSLNYKSWSGQAVSSTQSMSWPRTYFTFYDQSMNRWVEVEEGTVPLRLQRAVAELALHLLRYPEVTSGYETKFDSISVGPISVSNSNPGSDPGRIPTVPSKVNLLVAPLLNGHNSGNLWWRAN